MISHNLVRFVSAAVLSFVVGCQLQPADDECVTCKTEAPEAVQNPEAPEAPAAPEVSEVDEPAADEPVAEEPAEETPATPEEPPAEEPPAEEPPAPPVTPEQPEPEPETVPESYCGDGTCNEGKGEDCETCPSDCGEPPQEEPPAEEPPAEEPPTQEEPPVVEECYCGDGTCDDAEDSYNCPSDCGLPPEEEQPPAEEPATCSAPDIVVIKAQSPRTIWLSTHYVGQEACIIVESDSIASNGWGSTTEICDTDGDGYVAFTPPAGYVGTSRFTYRALGYTQNNSYADYGTSWQRDDLLCNSSVSLAFVGCPWYDSSDGSNDGSDAACDLFATWNQDGVQGNGNMGNYHDFN